MPWIVTTSYEGDIKDTAAWSRDEALEKFKKGPRLIYPLNNNIIAREVSIAYLRARNIEVDADFDWDGIP